MLVELSLIRILSFTIWYHFGYIVISTALLGFGASGTFLAIRPELGAHDLRSTLARCSWLAGAMVLGAVGFIAAVPLHPMSILEEPLQLALLVAYQVAAATPFFFSGLLVSLALRAGSARVDRLYFWDLVGAGLGCIAAVQLMNLLTPPGAAIVAAGIFVAAGAIFASAGRSRAIAAGLAVAVLLSAVFAERIAFTPARSKEYAILTSYFGMKPVFSRWTALFRTDAVEDVAPQGETSRSSGLSPLAPGGLEGAKLFLAHDATAGAGIYDLSDGYTVDELDYSVLQLPYRVANPRPRALVIGVGGGRDLVVASQFGASTITGVELDPEAIVLIRDELNDVTGGFFRQPHVQLVAAEGRHFVRSSAEEYDVIQLTGVDTLSAINSGAYVLAENYLYTVEAVHDFLDHLAPGGILSFAMGNVDPSQPRAAGRIVTVAQQALRERGVQHPERHIAVVDSRTLYVEIMIRTTPWEKEQLDVLESETKRLSFLPLWLPGRQGTPVFRGLARETGPGLDRVLASLRYKLTPTTDDNPFFMSFFRWTGLLEPGTIAPSHVTALSQIILVVLLISLTALGALFILLPLLVFRRRALPGRASHRMGVMLYFLSVGLGFMLFEISLIQRFVLFLGYPTYSLSVTLGSLLVFLGCGSYLSRRWVGRERRILPLAVAALAGLAAFYMFGLPVLQDQLLASSTALRVAMTAAVLAPLGLVMGIFFPLGIRVAADIHEDLVPWAWAINGCASVTAGVLAVILATSWGFALVWTLSVAIYAFGVLALLPAMPSGRDSA